ncbi:MAG: Carboxymuconolactone decarboxylase [Ramlibacter sp.]|jgi:nitrite reductase/ring-hydroxylating ferredoxin subunit/alkylhydroperoxidase/carboxymuconolactone decarboxylase family protein YurZ|nr:Carboxymuconolactone decarboxylase [Ramlibacter sp.]
MSDALDYLIKARPDAVGHYFAFLKACGKHLDPKTRSLISVITKVDAQTERGFRQYLGRALREGCTPMEILDALLMAFPTLGLAKIVWAVDIILAMDLPGFRPEALAGNGEWHDLGATRSVKAGVARRVECDGRALFVYRDGKDGWRVYDSRCPHQSTDIPHLALEGTQLTCPKHRWAFDLRTGDCVDKGNSPLRRWESRVVDGRLQAYW